MSVPEPTSGVPVWARKRRKQSNPLVGLVLVPLALFGAATAGLAIHDKSFMAAGARMDGWVAFAHTQTKAALGDLAGKPAKVATPDTIDEPAAGQSGRKGGR